MRDFLIRSFRTRPVRTTVSLIIAVALMGMAVSGIFHPVTAGFVATAALMTVLELTTL